MPDFAKEVIQINLEDEMKRSYLDYAMSVIVGRALPDVRDGLKPVHRRVLYAMSELGNVWNKPHKKSARVVGDVIGKYHPHGDTAAYDTIVRMAQPFSMRYMLVDGQGNFGSVDGDAPAAMRYTEVRMARIAHELLSDLDKDTVDFVPNYDNTEKEPWVLPTRVPNLLVNGSSGIAVGMATNIPPHNLCEVIDACVALADDPEIGLPALMIHLPGPDFPTAAIVNGTQGIREAYATGRGRVIIRARVEIEATRQEGKERIVVHELPYQVNKARLIEKIAELVKTKRIEGITELRDESDKDGMRVVIELRRGENAEVVLNNLYLHTQMQHVFGINMVALVDGQPRTLGLKQILEYFLLHRRDVVTRRTLFDLAKARERAHILEGLAIALANIDAVIELIRRAPSPAQAKIDLMARAWQSGAVELMLERANALTDRRAQNQQLGMTAEGYRMSDIQAQAILDLRLHRLTGLEQEKILGEYQTILERIGELLKILSSPEELMAVIRAELLDIRQRFGDARRTELRTTQEDLTMEDLIAEEDVVVTLSHAGYVKAQAVNLYQAQKRGGKGKIATTMKETDFVDKLFIANTHDTLLCFSSAGQVYWLKVYQLPQASRIAKGLPIVNLLPLSAGERINAVLPIRDFGQDSYLFFATASGSVKKTPLADYSRPRPSGIIAIDLKPDDYLVDVSLTDGERDIMLFSSGGKVTRFNEAEVRSMGRTAAGVRGIRMKEGQRVIAMIVVQPEGAILTVTENGYGKRTEAPEFPCKGRGGQGVLALAETERTGELVSAVQVNATDELMLITSGGTLVRTKAAEISLVGRNTQGVRLIRLTKDEKLVGLDRVASIGEETPGDEAEDPITE